MAPTKPAKGGARAVQAEEQELPCCPLCITELDGTEQEWLPCDCGYQLCLFCYDRIKTEFSNQCPGCRTTYDSDFQAGLLRRKVAAAAADKRAKELPQPPAPPRTATVVIQRPSAAASSPAGRPAVEPLPLRRAQQAQQQQPPASPARNLQVGREQVWPSLAPQPAPAAAASWQAANGSPPSAATQQQQQQQVRPAGHPPHPPHGREEAGSSASSATTATTTPRSPTNSVISYSAAAPPGYSGLQAAGRGMVRGRCRVSLQPSGLGGGHDPQGANLAASLAEAVRGGSLSVKQAAASLAAYLRQQRTSLVGSAPAGGSGRPDPFGTVAGVRGNGGAGSGGSPFDSSGHQTGGMGGGEHSMTAHWQRAGGAGGSGGGGLFDAWQQHPPGAANGEQLPVPANGGRLPLFARQGAGAPPGFEAAAPAANGYSGFPGFGGGAAASAAHAHSTALAASAAARGYKGGASPPGFSRPAPPGFSRNVLTGF